MLLNQDPWILHRIKYFCLYIEHRGLSVLNQGRTCFIDQHHYCIRLPWCLFPFIMHWGCSRLRHLGSLWCQPCLGLCLALTSSQQFNCPLYIWNLPTFDSLTSVLVVGGFLWCSVKLNPHDPNYTSLRHTPKQRRCLEMRPDMWMLPLLLIISTLLSSFLFPSQHCLFLVKLISLQVVWVMLCVLFCWGYYRVALVCLSSFSA